MGRPVPEMDQAALDQDVMQDLLRSIVKDRLGASATIANINTEHVKRGVYRYALELRTAGGGQTESMEIVGKVFDDVNAGRESYAIMQHLQENGFATLAPRHVRVPEAYRYLPELRLLLMQEAPGKPIKKFVKKQDATVEHMRGLADTLAKLHRFPAVPGEPHTLEKHLEIRCTGLAPALAEAFPAVEKEINWLLEKIRHYQHHWRNDFFTLAHGDFHLGQVHIYKKEFWLLDLDPLHPGDPAYDVAMVLFVLKQEDAKRGQTDYLNTLRNAFIEAYFSKMDWQIAGRIPLQEAMIHLKRACKRFRWQDEAGWEHTIPEQIRQAVNCINVMESGTLPTTVAALAAIDDRCPVNV